MGDIYLAESWTPDQDSVTNTPTNKKVECVTIDSLQLPKVDFIKLDIEGAEYEVLNKMIWSFQQLVHDDYDELYHHGTAQYSWRETDETYLDPITKKLEKTYEMIDTNPNEHWYDIEGHRLHEQRIQEGLELFGKYFTNLWD